MPKTYFLNPIGRNQIHWSFVEVFTGKAKAIKTHRLFIACNYPSILNANLIYLQPLALALSPTATRYRTFRASRLEHWTTYIPAASSTYAHPQPTLDFRTLWRRRRGRRRKHTVCAITPAAVAFSDDRMNRFSTAFHRCWLFPRSRRSGKQSFSSSVSENRKTFIVLLVLLLGGGGGGNFPGGRKLPCWHRFTFESTTTTMTIRPTTGS